MKRRNHWAKGNRAHAGVSALTLAIERRRERITLPVVPVDDDLALDPAIAAAAREIQRTWSAAERIARALWAYTAPIEWRA